MLLTCIRAVVVSNKNCNTDLPTDVLHSASDSLVENAEKIRVIKLMCSKIFSVSGTQINISNGKLCVCVCVCVCISFV